MRLHHLRPLATLTFAGLASVLTACSSDVGGGRASGRSNPSTQPGGQLPGETPPGSGTGAAPSVTPPGNSGTPAVPAGVVAGPTMLRRLTNIEYRNTVRDLLNLPAIPEEPLATDTLTRGFDNVSGSLTVPPAAGPQYAKLAEVHAAAFTPPTCSAVESDCAKEFITTFGRRAFRRPLSTDQQASYEALYASQRTRADHLTSIRHIVETMLQSPHLLYRAELGAPDSGPMRVLNSHEIATQLAYFLTATTPDETLLAAADQNALSSPAQIEQQARRLLALPQARPAIQHFLKGFIGVLELDTLSKDAQAFPFFTTQARQSAQAETERFIDTILWERDGTYASLFTSQLGFANNALAPLYGVADPGGEALVQVNLNPSERQGLLTQIAVLAAHSKPNESDPIKRGKWVRVDLLCQDLPAPPAMVPMLPPPEPGLSTRERLARHSSDGACSGCHSLLDPIGFGLENYNAVGQFRTTDDGGVAIDNTGVLSATQGIDGPFKGGVELANKLATSQEAQNCLAQRAYGWAFGRSPDSAERSAIQEAVRPLATSGLDVREVMVTLTLSENFRFRTFH